MNLREMRKRCGITQTELARRLGVRANAVTQWESGRRYPKVTMLSALTKALNCTFDELLKSEEK